MLHNVSQGSYTQQIKLVCQTSKVGCSAT